MFKRLINALLSPYYDWQERRRVKKRIEELRKRDPFIY